MKLIYVAHPFRGAEIVNVGKVARIWEGFLVMVGERQYLRPLKR